MTIILNFYKQKKACGKMGMFNTRATKTLLAATAIAGAGAVAAQILDDGIAGCIEQDGRLHFQMDDGDITAEPVNALQFNGDDNCIVSHGGGQAPDVYERVDNIGSDYAINLVEAATAFSNTKWETVQPTEQAHYFETFTAFLDGSDIVLMDESGEPATGILAIEFTETMMPVSIGDETSPEMGPDELTAGSAVFAYETDEGIQVGRVPAMNIAIQPN